MSAMTEPDRKSKAPGLLSVRDMGQDSAALWDAFVRDNAGTYCHLYGWRGVLEAAYSLRCHYLGIYAGESLAAILPVAELPRLLWAGRRAMSLPFCNYGGMLARPGVDTAQALSAALGYLADNGIRRLELRDVAPGHPNANEVSLHVVLPETEETLWQQAGDKARNQVRKARKNGLELRWGQDQGEDLYSIYAANMGRLGSPVHAKMFVLSILKYLPCQTDVLTVRLRGQAIGAMLVLKHHSIWADPFASTLWQYNSLNPAMLMYWEVLRAACAAGAKIFDLGRSPRDSGPYRFKLQWGAQKVALHYHSYVDGAPQTVFSTTFYRSNTAQRLAKAWSTLPAPLQNKLGPLARRWMP